MESPAYRWIGGELHKIILNSNLDTINLIGLNKQVSIIYRNINLLVSGKPALNTLLWGEKGAGKSMLVRLLVRDFAAKGLCVIEFCDNDYYSIYKLYLLIRSNPKKSFIIFFDDVSFCDDDMKFRNFKSIVEGGLEEKPSNAIFMATSNRRHLIKEQSQEVGDIYSRDDINEQTSLYARFGLAVGFYPLDKESYLKIVEYYLKLNQQNITDELKQESLNFALDRGGRSGRVAQHFATYQMIAHGDGEQVVL